MVPSEYEAVGLDRGPMSELGKAAGLKVQKKRLEHHIKVSTFEFLNLF